ncbi:xanthine dehydrogenase family protein molybdopterin-binding subunit [Bauldia litoralis]|uniref:Aldehyde oxidase and xanthine dehydrogenase, a/b hammerhead domain n=1 Tax=Bauldia litoralis TaxID=665467 RepID=A0A1G6AI89_9HYPH|nr:xanthine dehydrogenase family protein molybdopterin-binding subunit [Bauldia litoralis]SDB07853.1 Aldehyde oxidase and xanthine dehydrogenase, a/b hammerhead domain [Bauldia litoralis]
MEHIRKIFADERSDDHNAVGVSIERSDGLGHVTGKTQFYADRHYPGMLTLKMVRSPHHHAKILNVDTSAAEKMPGVVRVLTHADVPSNIYTILRLIQVEPNDEPVLAVDKVRFKGEAVVAVLAESEAIARDAVDAVRIDYEELPPVFDVEEALKPGAPLVNEYHGNNYFTYEGHHCRRVRYGDVEKGFAAADHVVEERYSSAPIEHAPVETTGCIVVPEANGRLTCYSNTQALFFTLDNAGLILNTPFQRLRLIGGTVGGGFGGKVDVITEPVAFLAADLTKRPVKFSYSREEEMQVSSPRAAERIYIKDGVMNDGRIVARQIRLYVDAGAYSRHSPYGTTKAAAHMPGPYTIPNVQVDAHCVYANRTPSSAMRGFGVTIGDFALEVQMDKIARLIGMDPMALRMLNAYRDGDAKAHGETTKGAALVEVMQEAAKLADWPLDGKYLSESSGKGG